MILAIKLRKLREEKNWSQLEIANELSISQSAYNKWENGKSKPTLPNLKKLASIFEVNFQELIQARISSEDIINLALKDYSLESNENEDIKNPSLLISISSNQRQIAKLMESQAKLIEKLLNNLSI